MIVRLSRHGRTFELPHLVEIQLTPDGPWQPATTSVEKSQPHSKGGGIRSVRVAEDLPPGARIRFQWPGAPGRWYHIKLSPSGTPVAEDH